tara:strand:- start:568 stop:1218 length:651 start_codon:yes stop_codon:yes gene_type:complete
MISKNLKKRIFTSLLLLFLFVLIFVFNEILIFSLVIFGVISILEFLNISRKIFSRYLGVIVSNLIFVIYIFMFCIITVYFSNILYLKIIFFSLFLSCIASDIGGYVFGKIFKGPKLTKISPNKTVSGSIGSLILSCLTISISMYFFTNSLNYVILFVGIITSLGCQMGDLFFSFLKRKAKIKDTGNFFPGHGGVLDRLDGIFFGIPAGFLTIIILG